MHIVFPGLNREAAFLNVANGLASVPGLLSSPLVATYKELLSQSATGGPPGGGGGGVPGGGCVGGGRDVIGLNAGVGGGGGVTNDVDPAAYPATCVALRQPADS